MQLVDLGFGAGFGVLEAGEDEDAGGGRGGEREVLRFEEVGMMVVGGGGAKSGVACWGRESGWCGG